MDYSNHPKLGINAMPVNRHLYDNILNDSTNEKEFASELDVREEAAVYVKLPGGFYITTPVGKYNPDCGIEPSALSGEEPILPRVRQAHALASGSARSAKKHTAKLKTDVSCRVPLGLGFFSPSHGWLLSACGRSRS
ncbi:hypothetical protein SDC9_54332 [bioreactor metagenome]|uniref:Type III restriction enzyme C-terminal endonuclease domain-containing protein n=1 Tax=bioreactor metagenome TaxID=1076179 RepID=A0A644WVV1_9ZZZZ